MVRVVRATLLVDGGIGAFAFQDVGGACRPGAPRQRLQQQGEHEARNAAPVTLEKGQAVSHGAGTLPAFPGLRNRESL